MSIIRLKQSLGDEGRIILPEPCISCHGCGPNNVLVGSSEGAEVIGISLTAHEQCHIFWNSLGKPVFFLFLATLMSNLFGLNEPESVIAAVIGFLLGYLNCDAIPETLLEKSKC